MLILELLDVLVDPAAITEELIEGASLLPMYALSFESLDSKLESECLSEPPNSCDVELVGLVGVKAVDGSNFCCSLALYLSIRVEKSLYVTSTSSTHDLIEGAWACPVSTSVSASCNKSLTRSRVSLAFS